MNKHPTYLHDIPDFLRMIEERNEGPPLPPNTILASLYVSVLYTNIPQEGGLKKHCTLEIILKFQFDKTVEHRGFYPPSPPLE